MRGLLRSTRDDGGYVAVVTAIVVASLFSGLAAIGVDLARVYLEVDRVQKAADAAALAGVVYMPDNLSKAVTAATATATRNGYTNSSTVTVTVAQGDKPTQLMVTISSTIPNTFGQAFGVRTATVTRSATADYTAPAPIGSPCNAFGNEPPSQSGAALPTDTSLPASSSQFSTCKTDANGRYTPQFWAAVEGPETDKVQGDRYQAQSCNETGQTGGKTYGCGTSQADCASAGNATAPDTNCDYKQEGYFWSIHVNQAAVGSAMNVEIYDPSFVYTGAGVTCPSLPDKSALADNMNPYTTTDGTARYAKVSSNTAATIYCPGDNVPASSGASCSKTFPATGAALDCTNPVTTSFALRHATDTYDPLQGAVISGCTKQYKGSYSTPTVAQLTSSNTSYLPQMAKVFHEWVSLCSFTPDVAGDYYLQVRTNVSLGGTPETASNAMIYTDNPAVTATAGNTNIGEGANSFSLRAVPVSPSNRTQVSFSGFQRMPILQIAKASTASFNLVRALPNTAGETIKFDFYDAADGSDNGGQIKVIAPTDSSGFSSGTGASSVIAGCKFGFNDDSPSSYQGASNCAVGVQGTKNDGQLEHMQIPIPSTYKCDQSTLGGCWFQVQVTFTDSVTDYTTWNARIDGAPVRLVK